MDGTRLLRRAIKLSNFRQADFARIYLRVSHRTLTRMLTGEKAIDAPTKDELRRAIKDLTPLTGGK